ncbi:MAG: hypothetical protein JXB48_09570 [Candidatus Latescibacteria bacterium]|nr:hypothetical protein [Candidatus Latescibacterota bacterium]
MRFFSIAVVYGFLLLLSTEFSNAAISGHVVDGNGSSLENALVTFIDEQDASYRDSCSTDSDGRYLVFLEPATDFTVNKGKQGCLDLSWKASDDETYAYILWYRIYRSRTDRFTDPVLLSEFSTVDDMLVAERYRAVLIDSVSAGVTSWNDCLKRVDGAVYHYWIEAVGISGKSILSSVRSITGIDTEKPQSYRLGQNYPNPFNPSTIIPFSVAEYGRVRLDIFNIIGQHVRTLIDDYCQKGDYTAIWDGRNYNGVVLGAGLYFYRLKSGRFTSAGKMLKIDGGGQISGGLSHSTITLLPKKQSPLPTVHSSKTTTGRSFHITITYQDEILYDGSDIRLDDGQTMQHEVTVVSGGSVGDHAGTGTPLDESSVANVNEQMFKTFFTVINEAEELLAYSSGTSVQIDGAANGYATVTETGYSSGTIVKSGYICTFSDYSGDGILYFGGRLSQMEEGSMSTYEMKETWEGDIRFAGSYAGNISYSVSIVTDSDGEEIYHGICTATAGNRTFTGVIPEDDFNDWRSGGGESISTAWGVTGSGVATDATAYLPAVMDSWWSYISGAPLGGETESYTMTVVDIDKSDEATIVQIERNDTSDTKTFVIENDLISIMHGEIEPEAGLFKISDTYSSSVSSEEEQPYPYFRFNVTPGTIWDIYSRTEGGWGVTITYTVTGMYIGLETVVTTAGNYEYCARFDITYSTVTNFGSTAQGMSVWFAPGIGIVKTVVGSITDGDFFQFKVDVLTATSLGEGVSPGHTTSASGFITPEQGGAITLKNWRNDKITLFVPPDAVTTTTYVTMTTRTTAPSNTLESWVFPGVSIEPSSLIFQKAARLSISLASSPESSDPVMCFWYTDPAAWEVSSTVAAIPVNYVNNGGSPLLGAGNGYSGGCDILTGGVFASGIPTNEEIGAQYNLWINPSITFGKQAAPSKSAFFGGFTYGWWGTNIRIRGILNIAERAILIGDENLSQDMQDKAREIIENDVRDFLDQIPPSDCDEEYIHTMFKYMEAVMLLGVSYEEGPGKELYDLMEEKLARCKVRFLMTITFEQTLTESDVNDMISYSGSVEFYTPDFQGATEENTFRLIGPRQSLPLSGGGSNENCVWTHSGSVDIDLTGEIRVKDFHGEGWFTFYLNINTFLNDSIPTVCDDESYPNFSSGNDSFELETPPSLNMKDGVKVDHTKTAGPITSHFTLEIKPISLW